MLISTLSLQELIAEAVRDEFPKWESMCLLRAVGAPTLEAMLIAPMHTSEDDELIKSRLSLFSQVIDSEKVMLRAAPRRETSNIRGGNTYSYDEAENMIRNSHRERRAVIVLEPTDRLCNRLNIGIAVEPNGNWQAEILGAGFDASDLMRGTTLPEFICRGLALERDNISRLREHDGEIIKIECNMEERIARRLESVVHYILPTVGIDLRNEEAASSMAANWMHDRGYNHLFRSQMREFPHRYFEDAFEVAQLVYNLLWKQRRETSFVIASSVLAESRIVYWDVTDGRRKWGESGRVALRRNEGNADIQK